MNTESTNKTTIGIFGGSFNPPHLGHVLICSYALSIYNINKIIVVPCKQHPFNKELLPFQDRFNMATRAFSFMRHNVIMSDVENHLESPNYTYRTLKALQAEYKKEFFDFRLIVGEDILLQLNDWKNIDEIKEIAEPFIIIPRGNSIIPDISSTQVRNILARKISLIAKRELLKYILPHEVLTYILQKNIYSE